MKLHPLKLNTIKPVLYVEIPSIGKNKQYAGCIKKSQDIAFIFKHKKFCVVLLEFKYILIVSQDAAD